MSQSGISAVGRIARPAERRPAATAAPGCGIQAAYPWRAAYRAEYSGLQLPPRPERRHARLRVAYGVHVRVLEPLRRYAVSYSDPDRSSWNVRVRGDYGAQPPSDGRRSVLQGRALRPGGPLTGTMVLRGEAIPDRLSLGPRPLLGSTAAWVDPSRRGGRPRRRHQRGTSAGVGYSFCAADPDEAWLSTPSRVPRLNR